MLYVLQNEQARIIVSPDGARLVAVETPDRDGVFGHVVLGFDDLESCRAAGGSFGAVLGRCANRIADASFTLDGQTHQLNPNDHGNILHGGAGGFGTQLWQTEHYDESGTPRAVFSLVSVDGDQGFPGTVVARADYRLEADTLILELTATTDAPTIVNLSSHPYFNLGDVAQHDVLDHEITIDASHYLPTDASQIPTGELRSVADSVFDFRNPHSLGERIRQADPQLLIASGYDHCFVLNQHNVPGARFAARAYCPRSGRMLEIYTSQPGLQLYSGNNLTGAAAGRGGIALRQSAGFAMESQNFPNAANQPNFPSAVLRPGAEYHHVIAYKFTATRQQA